MRRRFQLALYVALLCIASALSMQAFYAPPRAWVSRASNALAHIQSLLPRTADRLPEPNNDFVAWAKDPHEAATVAIAYYSFYANFWDAAWPWPYAAYLATGHLIVAIAVLLWFRSLTHPPVPARFAGGAIGGLLLASTSAAVAAFLTIPLPAVAYICLWFWHDMVCYPPATKFYEFLVSFGPLAHGAVWMGVGLIYLRVQVAVVARVLGRAQAHLDADPHTCGRCGYARTATGTTCPECGWTYSVVDRLKPRLVSWPRARAGRLALEAAFWALVVLLLNGPYTVLLAYQWLPDSWRALAPWLRDYI